MLYADNAATTRLDEDAYKSMIRYMMEDYGNPSQPYSFSRVTKDAIREARRTIALCIGADENEIFFTSGGTESDNWALKGYIKKNARRKFIISSIEHHAVIKTAIALEREGYDFDELNVTREGIVMPSFLESSIDENVSLVSVMLANNEIGSIEPIKELTKIAHKNGIAFHTDAVQAVGHIEIDVKKLGVDMLSASAHKFNGPRGIGFLYVKNGIQIYPFMDGGSQEQYMRAGTENVPAIVGMATALKKNCETIVKNREYLSGLENELILGLKNRGICFIQNGAQDHLPGLVSLSFHEADGEMLLHRLDLMGISVSTGSACDSKNTKLSHVISAIGVPDEYAYGTIRISLCKYNTMDDVKGIVDGLAKILT